MKELNDNSVDVCYLQETHCSSKFTANNWNRKWGGTFFWSFGSNRSKGVGIWIRSGLNLKIISTDKDSEGRLLFILIKINNVSIRLANIYAPVIPSERRLFFNSLHHYLVGNCPVILGGDFNCVQNINLDKRGGNEMYGNFASEQLISLCDDNNLIDVFRKLHPAKREYTWKNSLNSIFCRLDRFYITDSLLTDVLSFQHHPINYNFSDHGMIHIDITIGENVSYEVGPGYWKCNTNILKDPFFQEDFKMLWETLDSIPDQDSEWWEQCKIKFRYLIMGHSMRLSHIRHSELKEAKQDLKRLFCLEEQNGTSFELQHQIKLAQGVIDKLNDNFLEGSKIRSKAQYLENNERPTRFFLRKEKKSATDKYIKSLRKEDGSLVNSKEGIKKECKSFYKKLYSSKEIDPTVDDYFLKDIPTLNPNISELCEGEFTIEECYEALKLMLNYKTPGPDGLPKEFYSFAFPFIGKSYVKLINRCLLEGTLPLSLRQCYITLICKDKTKADLLTNWRPISLLNCDYKILSKVLSLRMRNVIGEIVHPDQTCSIPGRSIQDNVHLIRNLVEYVDDKNMPAAIISLDQTKAFDRVSHEYLFKVLHSFGFGNNFISLVKLLYTNIFSCVLVNGFVSEEFPVQCSVRQGCSLSPLLYVLCMEPFAHRIRRDPMIRGIPMPGTPLQCKVCQYADDTNLFVSDIQSVRKILILVELFELVSAAKLNKLKTFGLWLGCWRGRLDQPAGLKWLNGYAKFYGIFIGTDEGFKRNWDILISKFKNVVDLYSSRDLSFKGKSVILKAVICNSIWYVGSLTLMPDNVLQKLNKVLFSFLWSNKTEAVKRLTLIDSFENGGLDIVDIKTKLETFRVSQVLQLIKGTKANWKYFAVYWIGFHLRKYVPAFASLSIPHADYIPKYYNLSLQMFRVFESKVPEFMFCQKITTKFIYYHMLDNRKQPPRILKVYPTIDFNKAWKWIQCSFVDPKYRDLAWRVINEILPTQSYLYKFNISRNAKCYLCKRSVETLSHLFFACPMLNGLWKLVEDVLFQLTDSQVKITIRAILFNIFQPHVTTRFNELLILLVNLMKYCIWITRNEAKHESKNVTTIGIKAFFIRTLSSRIRADHKRFDSDRFCKYWCKNNNIVHLDGESIKILLRLHPP